MRHPGDNSAAYTTTLLRTLQQAAIMRSMCILVLQKVQKVLQSRLQQGEGPSRGLLRDYKPSD